MTINDSAVLLPGVGHVLTGVVGAAKPSLANLITFAGNTATPPTGFTSVGHTDLDQVFTFGQDGGDTTVKGSWQNKSLREIVTASAVDYLVFKALQVLDNDVLTLYYGGGNIAVANEFALPDAPTPQERAFMVVMLDGANPVALYARKASLRRESEIEVASDDFTKLPIRATLLKDGANPRAVWIADPLGA